MHTKLSQAPVYININCSSTDQIFLRWLVSTIFEAYKTGIISIRNYFGDLEAHAKFRNPMKTSSWVLGTVWRKNNFCTHRWESSIPGLRTGPQQCRHDPHLCKKDFLQPWNFELFIYYSQIARRISVGLNLNSNSPRVLKTSRKLHRLQRVNPGQSRSMRTH